jgi:glycosyltransferase involved in cell wall biosynthesis
LLVIKTYAQECDATPWITKCLREKRNAPRIIYVQENTPAVLIPGYYTMADCFILPFRGEGFALPVLEAMACALPTIVTDWGGPSQFINSDISILLGYNLVRAEGFHMPVPKEALWAEPSRGEIRAGMLWMVSHPEEAKAMALRARQVALKWTWKGAAYKILRETGVL